jgi:purine-binding chemotaxis protein CheW
VDARDARAGSRAVTSPRAQAKPAIERAQIVIFRVGDQQYAADVFSVERVLRFVTPRPIPNVPAWLDGVIDYEGRVVPVLDLRTRFDLPLAEHRELGRILVLVTAGAEGGESRIAAVVDAVDEVATVNKPDFEDPPAIFRGLARKYLRALLRRGEQVVVVLDVAELLNSRERIVIDQAMAEATTNG